MPGTDWIPVVSQLKAGLQLITGDVDGAKKTTQNFFQECPGVSQATSVVQLVAGDPEGALETQKRCLGTINNVANGIPVVGHVKGVVHHIVGDHEGGNQALNAATRSSVVIASGAAAGLATGGLGAIPAGLAAGATYDITDSVITHKPKGIIAAVGNAIDNPSAGSIFDAGAAFVADGVAGYSGGQIANKVATQIELNGLEATRAAKLEQLDSAMFGESSQGGMTSGQMHTLGQEINVLTGKINTITHGTPQYWFDPKTNQISVGRPVSNTAVPVVANFGEGDRGKEAKILSKVYQKQENAFEHDLYEVPISAKTPQEKAKVLDKYNNLTSTSGSLDQTYPNLDRIQPTQLQRARDSIRNFSDDPRENLRQRVEELDRKGWVHVPMPREFPFTGAAMVSSSTQGLLHTFLRHSDQWMQFIPSLRQVWDRLSPIHRELNNILAARGNSPTRINEFHSALLNLPSETFARVISDLLEAQSQIHEFLSRTTRSYQNYIGNGINGRDHQQVYFEATDSNGQRWVMVVCVSDQMFDAEEFFDSSRPVRTVITVFFVPYDGKFKKNFYVKKSF